MIAVDYNNDGKDELIMEQQVAPASSNTVNLIQYHFDNSSSSLVEDGSTPYTTPLIPLTMQYADFYGDGKNEVIIQDKDQNFIGTIGGSVPTNAFSVIPNPIFVFPQNNNYQFDYTGDGKNDILCVTPTDVEVWEYKLDPATSTYKFVKICYDAAGNFLANCTVFPGDFNGDGKTDLLNYNPADGSSGNWWIVYSTGNTTANGNGFDWKSTSQVYGLPSGITPVYPPPSGYTTGYYIISDANGDGKSDIIFTNQNSGTCTSSNPNDNTPVALNVYLSRGESVINGYSTTFEPLTPQTSCIGFQSSQFPNQLFLGDFNGDGNTDILWQWTSNNFETYFLNKDGENDFVTSVVDGLNKYTDFNYSTLAKGDYYTKGNFAVFPVNDIQSAMHVVANMITPNNLSSIWITFRELLLCGFQCFI